MYPFPDEAPEVDLSEDGAIQCERAEHACMTDPQRLIRYHNHAMICSFHLVRRAIKNRQSDRVPAGSGMRASNGEKRALRLIAPETRPGRLSSLKHGLILPQRGGRDHLTGKPSEQKRREHSFKKRSSERVTPQAGSFGVLQGRRS